MEKLIEPNLNSQTCFVPKSDDSIERSGETAAGKKFHGGRELSAEVERLEEKLKCEEEKWILIEYRYKYLEEQFAEFLQQKDELKSLRKQMSERKSFEREYCDKSTQTVSTIFHTVNKLRGTEICSSEDGLLSMEKHSLENINSMLSNLKAKIEIRSTCVSLENDNRYSSPA